MGRVSSRRKWRETTEKASRTLTRCCTKETSRCSTTCTRSSTAPRKVSPAHPADQCLYVNSKRYDFSQNVLEAGHRLVQSFIDIQHLIRKNYIRATYDNSANPNVVSVIHTEMTRALESFDVCWTSYEKV